MNINTIKSPDGTIYHVNPDRVTPIGTRQHLLEKGSPSSNMSGMEIASANTFYSS